MWKLTVPEDVLEKLRCSLCKEYLSQLPIYSYPGQEGVGCGRCPVLSDQNPIRDVSYEAVAKHLLFPCRYKPYGCLEHILPAQMQIHEESCMYKQYFCPFIPLASCPWQGPSNELLNHYQEHHSALVLHNSQFEIDLVNMYEDNYLLLHMENLFIVHIKCDSTENILWCSVRYVGDNKLAKKFMFQAEIKRHDNNVTIKLPTKVVDCDNNMNLDKNSAVYVSTDEIITELGDPCSVVCCISILPNELNGDGSKGSFNGTTPTTTIADAVDENILRELECPICNDYMVPPIHQCVAGHSICATCKQQINECPICKDKIQDTRNYMLESMIRYIKYCCKYRDYGCSFVSTSEKIRNHEAECTFGPYSCPINGYITCPWKGKLSDIMEHIKREHEDNTLQVEVITYPFLDDGEDETDEDCLLFKAYEDIFRLFFRYENDHFYWTVQVVGPTENSSKYMFELDFLDNSGSNQRFYLKRKCNSMTKYKDAFKSESEYIVLPVYLLRPFIHKDDLIYKFRVTKK